MSRLGGAAGWDASEPECSRPDKVQMRRGGGTRRAGFVPFGDGGGRGGGRTPGGPGAIAIRPLRGRTKHAFLVGRQASSPPRPRLTGNPSGARHIGKAPGQRLTGNPPRPPPHPQSSGLVYGVQSVITPGTSRFHAWNGPGGAAECSHGWSGHGDGRAQRNPWKAGWTSRSCPGGSAEWTACEDDQAKTQGRRRCWAMPFGRRFQSGSGVSRLCAG